MSDKITRSEPCQVDFYLLSKEAPEAGKLACRLALMTWERKQKTFIIAASETAGEQLDALMWQYPEGRFLPHTRTGDKDSDKAPVHIGVLSDLNPTDVVINLCPEAVPQPERFSRLLEIVPYADNERQASRVKYKIYRNLGLKPQTHEMDTPSR
ncbi:MAG: DNA polymerase III subunit chi [Gammaproteobacteria bacterium]|nr:DNA polymerase III subunit chi [Gammaproteobacteria bacterium]